MAHPDDRSCLQGKSLGPIQVPGFQDRAELRRTRFKDPFLVRWRPREGDPGRESYWAVATRLLVTMKPGVAPRDAERILRDIASGGAPGIATVRVEPLPLEDLYLIERRDRTPVADDVGSSLLARRDEFENDEDIDRANPDYLCFSLPEDRSMPARPAPSELVRLGVTEAHRLGKVGSRDVRVAVLDTGVDTRHEDLMANILRDNGEIVGYDFHRDRAEVRDGNGHGTFCAGLIGGLGYGVNQEVSIIPVTFLSSSGCGTTSDAIKGIQFALNHKARVISNSWGGVADSPELNRMIGKANSEKTLFVSGAGNAARDLDSVKYYPAAYEQPNMISVGGALDGDEPAPQWGFGRRRVHLAAPGETVLSTHHDPRHGETWRSGTSVSTAFVAGACALVIAELEKAGVPWNHLDVRKRIIQSVTPMSDGTIQAQAACCAAGRLNVLNAVVGSSLNPSLNCPGA